MIQDILQSVFIIPFLIYQIENLMETVDEGYKNIFKVT